MYNPDSFRVIKEFLSKLEVIQILLVPSFILADVFIFLWLFYYHKYLQEADPNLSFWQIGFNNLNKVSKAVIEKRKNFFKSEPNPSPNKKLALLFFKLMILALLFSFTLPLRYLFAKHSMQGVEYPLK